MIVHIKTPASSHDNGNSNYNNKSATSLKGQLFRLIVIFLVGSILGHVHGRFSFIKTNTIIEHNAFVSNAITINDSEEKSPIISTETSSFDFNNEEDNNQTKNRSSNWRSIQVFYGDTRQHLEAALNSSNASVTTFALQQDRLVLGLLRNKQGGYFVDLAAGDAIEQSHTLALEYHAHWNGLCLEPNPLYWYGLAYHRTCQVVAAVIGPQYMEAIEFRYSNYHSEYFGGGVPRRFDHRGNEAERDEKLQFTIPLLELLRVHRAPRTVDYLHLDVGGAEEHVMQGFDFSKYTFTIVTMRRQPPPQGGGGLHDIFHQAGYQLLKNLTETEETLWAHTSTIAQLDLTALTL